MNQRSTSTTFIFVTCCFPFMSEVTKGMMTKTSTSGIENRTYRLLSRFTHFQHSTAKIEAQFLRTFNGNYLNYHFQSDTINVFRPFLLSSPSYGKFVSADATNETCGKGVCSFSFKIFFAFIMRCFPTSQDPLKIVFGEVY